MSQVKTITVSWNNYDTKVNTSTGWLNNKTKLTKHFKEPLIIKVDLSVGQGGDHFEVSEYSEYWTRDGNIYCIEHCGPGEIEIYRNAAYLLDPEKVKRLQSLGYTIKSKEKQKEQIINELMALYIECKELKLN